MFNGKYGFFDYKYNIAGYTGQDYGGIAQYLYLGISIVLLTILLIISRKFSKEKVLKITKIISIFLIILYIVKTTWESIYDIKMFGKFNTGLLPFDTCSIIMLAGIISSFSKGKMKKYTDCWIATGAIVGGIANMLFLSALNYYPFFTFGAFYSMIWHFLMVYIGLLYIVTNYVPMKYSTIVNGFIFQLIISLLIIPIDFIFDFDFMLLVNLSSVPFFEGVASHLTAINMQFLNPILMLALYYFSFNLVFLIPFGIKKILNHRK